MVLALITWRLTHLRQLFFKLSSLSDKAPPRIKDRIRQEIKFGADCWEEVCFGFAEVTLNIYN